MRRWAALAVLLVGCGGGAPDSPSDSGVRIRKVDVSTLPTAAPPPAIDPTPAAGADPQAAPGIPGAEDPAAEPSDPEIAPEPAIAVAPAFEMPDRAPRGYDAIRIVYPELSENPRPQFTARLVRRIGTPGGFTEVRVREPAGDRVVASVGATDGLATLPLAAVRLLATLRCEDNLDQELDLLVPIEDGALAPVSTWCLTDGAVAVASREGPVQLAARIDPEGTPTADFDDVRRAAAEVSARHGLGAFVDRKGRWDLDELAVVDAALAEMLPEERAILGGLPWYRDGDGGVGGDVSEAAYYEQSGAVAAFVVLDQTFGRQEVAFVGTPEAAHPRAAYVLLHEAGHALTRASARIQAARAEAAGAQSQSASAEASEEFAAYEAAYDARKHAMEAFNAAAHTYNEAIAVPLSDAEIARIKAEVHRLKAVLDPLTRSLEVAEARYEAERAKARTADAEADRQYAAARQLVEDNPLLAAFSAVPGAGKGPTRYAQVSLSEAFAECYALFRLDPAALKRFSPDLHAWFAQGAHRAWLP